MLSLVVLLKSTLTLFAIINPIGSIPIFLQLTHRMSKEERKKSLLTGLGVALIILIIFVFTGEQVLLRLFQIEMVDLMAAGGLLLLIIAIDHLIFGALAKGVLKGEKPDAHGIGAVPIACPILAGPGAMVTVLLIASQTGLVNAGLSVILVMGITYFIFRFIEPIYQFLGDIVCVVLSKILCLFIAAIGMRLLLHAILQYVR